MDFNSLPSHIKQLFQNKDMTMNQKIATLAAFMPDQPDVPKVDHNHELGMKIKRLVEEGKIRLGKFDKKFILEVETVA
jgi:hypothetical protein